MARRHRIQYRVKILPSTDPLAKERFQEAVRRLGERLIELQRRQAEIREEGPPS